MVNSVDMTQVNALFQRLPCRIPSAPATASSLAFFKFEVLVDLKDAFFHIACPNELKFLFRVCSQLASI